MLVAATTSSAGGRAEDHFLQHGATHHKVGARLQVSGGVCEASCTYQNGLFHIHAMWHLLSLYTEHTVLEYLRSVHDIIYMGLLLSLSHCW